jgi:hypothetical protein
MVGDQNLTYTSVLVHSTAGHESDVLVNCHRCTLQPKKHDSQATVSSTDSTWRSSADMASLSSTSDVAATSCRTCEAATRDEGHVCELRQAAKEACLCWAKMGRSNRPARWLRWWVGRSIYSGGLRVADCIVKSLCPTAEDLVRWKIRGPVEQYIALGCCNRLRDHVYRPNSCRAASHCTIWIVKLRLGCMRCVLFHVAIQCGPHKFKLSIGEN